MLVLKNAKIILENKILYGKALVLGDKIEAIIEETEIPSAQRCEA